MREARDNPNRKEKASHRDIICTRPSLHSCPRARTSTARMAYLLFRPHRFVINLGYGFGEESVAMSSASQILSSMLLELLFELIIDSAALCIEHTQGIDMNHFWSA